MRNNIGFKNASGDKTFIPDGMLKEIAQEGWGFWGGGSVVYGIPGKSVTKNVPGDGYCTSDFFGSDPAPGQVKKCYSFEPTTAATGPAFSPPAPSASPMSQVDPNVLANNKGASSSGLSTMAWVGIITGSLAVVGVGIYFIAR